ncbi:MAG: hypothetical protein H6Q31_105 [Bacteroidetes bacterium]|jgi:hypothetical protein|nr:hypothetical protein [Bacteroidota bacterium]
MKRCPTCGTENDEFAVVCVSCKGFIQSKVDTLDLFHTIWGLFESPAETFRRIGLARVKNYVILLTIGFGIALAYMLFWNANFGVAAPNLTTIIGLGLLVGPVLGLLVVGTLALLVTLVAPKLGGSLKFRNGFAVLAYAAVPVVMTLVVVFPIELGVFGIYLFDNNPPPIVLNPVAFIVLTGIDGVAACWSLVLSGIGIRVVAGLSPLWSVAFVVVCAAAIGALFLIPLR